MTLRITPADAFAIAEEAHALHSAGDFAGAIEKFYQALEIAPREAFLRRDLGVCLGNVGQYKEALLELQRAIAINPNDPSSHSLLGTARGFVGDYAGAKESYDRALEIAPNSPVTLWNRSLWYLLMRDYKRGWDEYQWGVVQGSRTRRTRRLEATAETIKGMQPGQTLFIWCEQGYGDTLQFMRFIKPLKEKYVPEGVRIVFEIQPELLPILFNFPVVDQVICQNETSAIPLHNFEHISLLSIPGVMELYDEADFWQGRYLPCAEKEISETPRIGVCWKGNPKHPNDANRSIDSAEFWKAFDGLYDISMVSLVPGESGDADISTFDKTMSVIAQMDVVITVDTAVAHLAGGMGKIVWLMVPFVPDFRWSLERDTTPWYPSMRLFRQKSVGDWSGVLLDVRKELVNHGIAHEAADNITGKIVTDRRVQLSRAA